ncbi:uracil phosphoribosyltransferase [Synechococcus sp. PCC 7502]|uniref:uracil phosphoribosyltransferase n=1 Tax=Synechococcus sp. PCC 7502 TaxID=1173263 RepID=UPI00029FE25B|nr:uracil phosphoribosyltransferase [Synechococcus sp. PCC 7502]AFY73799.1 uracil phosphoribosyltransferase [Synechococcus sp. PCC 7502]
MTEQLKVFVKKHPLIDHWLTIARDKNTPVPIFRTAMQELGKWLTYEAIRDWLPTQPVNVETPLAVSQGEVIDASVPLAIVPILRAGLPLLESCQALVPNASIYHLGFVRDEATLENSLYLNRLPRQLLPQTRILITEPMLATGGTIMSALNLLTASGADPSLIRIINIVCAPPALQKINQNFPSVQIYSAMIDPEVNAQGWIVPGLGDAGDRSFGTF